jgi:hypothetical protein
MRLFQVIVATLFITGNGFYNFPVHRIIIGNNVVPIVVIKSRQKRQEERIANIEKENKCSYAKQLFYRNATCSIKPERDYTTLYEKSYKMKLWEFWEKECSMNPLFDFVICISVIVFCLFILNSTW